MRDAFRERLLVSIIGSAALVLTAAAIAAANRATSDEPSAQDRTATDDRGDLKQHLEHIRHRPHQETVPDFASFVPLRQPDPNAPVATSIERISTVVPWPRGVAFVDGQLVALARGRHRSGGGVAQTFQDHAGSIYIIDPEVAEPVVVGQVATATRPAGDGSRNNGRVFVQPQSPPFFLYDYSVVPEEHLLMTRPYCGLDYDPISRNLFICAFAGAELEGGSRFRKHATDSLLRYDLRDETWRIVEQHDHTTVPVEKLGSVISNEFYPHHDPTSNPPPHGWLNGNTGCRVVGDFLYATAKDNHLLVQYDLSEIRRDPDAPPPPSRPVLGPRITIRIPDAGGEGGYATAHLRHELREIEFLGAASVAAYGDWLYVGTRTSSIVIRVPIDERGDIVRGEPAELIAIFEPWDAERGRSGDMFDMALNSAGDLFVSMSREGRVWKITNPDPAAVFFANDRDPAGREVSAAPWADLSKLLGKRTGAANIAFDESDRLYVCTRNNDFAPGESPIDGVIYRVTD